MQKVKKISKQMFALIAIMAFIIGMPSTEFTVWASSTTTEEVKETCTDCSGSGKCSICDGTGQKSVTYSTGRTSSIRCSTCRAKGECKTCKGTGIITKKIVKENKTTDTNKNTNSSKNNGTCTSCSGTGKCNICDGTGKKTVTYESTGRTSSIRCSTCNATGKCTTCKGTGSTASNTKGNTAESPSSNTKGSTTGSAEQGAQSLAPDYEKNVLTATVDGEDCIFYLGSCKENEEGTWDVLYIAYSSQEEPKSILRFTVDLAKLDLNQSSNKEDVADHFLFSELDGTKEITEAYCARSGVDVGKYEFNIEKVGTDNINSRFQGTFDASLVFFSKITKFDKNKVVKIKNAVYDFTLNGYYEKTEKAAVPSSGENAKAGTSGSASANAQGSSTGNASSSAAGSTASNTTGSAKSNVCSYCGGYGECEKCVGLGECDHCYGEGYVECGSCGISGMCQSCYGMGGKEKYSYGDIKWIECSRCKGTGDCSRCKGAGQQICSYCKGQGTCSYCKGSAICSYCGGTGER